MTYPKICLISPPFYSHFRPLLALAKSFKGRGARVSLAVSPDFRDQVLEAGISFYELNISLNKNLASPGGTGPDKKSQPEAEERRLEEFFLASRQGAVSTLITQAQHRKKDMLYDPQAMLDKIRALDKNEAADLYLVDVLSYSVTLSLYVLGLNFISYCPPHPDTLLAADTAYGIPPHWPAAIRLEKEKLDQLYQASQKTSQTFTQAFNQLIRKESSRPPVAQAFALRSPLATIYNYVDFAYIDLVTAQVAAQEKARKDGAQKETQAGFRDIYMGHSFSPKTLEAGWKKRLEEAQDQGYEKKILLTFGTFLSQRQDVLEKILAGLAQLRPRDLVIVAAGKNAPALTQAVGAGPGLIISDFIPQVALMPYMDTVIFHGGCNSFTEALYYGKKMLVLPFSSDQFSLAYDVESQGLGQVLDPNHFTRQELARALKDLEASDPAPSRAWAQWSQKRGPDYVARLVLEELGFR